MRLEFWARLLAHATLALAAACLAYSESYFVPALQLCFIPFLVLLGAAFLTADRWALPSWAANVLGAVIAGGSFSWLVLQLSREGSLLHELPLPAGLLPYLGPVLLALLVVGLFRQRGPGSFWALQGVGLVQVCLACVLTTGPLFGVLLAAYLACGLGALVLHHFGAEAARGRTPRASLPSVSWLARFVLRYALGVGALALGVFLLTPRGIDGETWDPLQRFGPGAESKHVTGFGEEVDLNGGGNIETSEEVAFSVEAYTKENGENRPKKDLPADTRWRGLVLDHYANGVWSVSGTYRIPPNVPAFRSPADLPDLGSGQFYLIFDVRLRKAGGLFLAEPVRMAPGPTGSPRRLPVRYVRQADRQRLPSLFFEHPHTGTLMPQPFTAQTHYLYEQVTVRGPDPDRVPAEIPARSRTDYIRMLTLTGPPALDGWTRKLIDRLCGQGSFGLTPELRNRLAAATAAAGFGGDDAPYRVPAEYREVVARALSSYLASSGEYAYTLDQRQVLRGSSRDPVVAFLCNTRQGNCERFAAGLALMLRSQGVPTRLVRGFRGAERVGDLGTYQVRQNMAHAWVEVLVPAAVPGSFGSEWLSLDPTTAFGDAGAAPATGEGGLGTTWGKLADFWKRLVVNYNADRQADVWGLLVPGKGPSRLLDAAARGWPWVAAGLLGVAALLSVWRFLPPRGVRRRGAPATGLLLYARLLRILARRARLRPGRAQTPREFGEAAASCLRGDTSTASLSDVPTRVVDLLYRVRFGGELADEAETQALGERLERLAAALRS